MKWYNKLNFGYIQLILANKFEWILNEVFGKYDLNFI